MVFVKRDIKIVLASNIKDVLQFKKMKQSDLANITDIREKTISRICNAQSNCHMDTVEKIADGLGVPIERLFWEYE